jgi:hypothetical protein
MLDFYLHIYKVFRHLRKIPPTAPWDGLMEENGCTTSKTGVCKLFRQPRCHPKIGVDVVLQRIDVALAPLPVHITVGMLIVFITFRIYRVFL